MNRKLKKRVRELIPLLSDGELSAEELKLVDEAIRSYPELKDELSEFNRLMEITEGLKDEPSPDLIEERILSKVKSQNAKSGIIKRFLKYIITPPRKFQIEVFGAVAVAVLVLFLFIRLFPKTEFSPGVVLVPEESKEEIAGTSEPESLEPKKPPETTSDLPSEDFDMAPSAPGAIFEEPEEKTLSSFTEKKKGIPIKLEGDIATGEKGKGKPLAVSRSLNGVSTKDIEIAVGEGPEISLKSRLEDEKLKKTTLVLVGDDKSPLPVSLTIYTHDPYNTEMDIMNKAVELGGEIKRVVGETGGYYEEGDLSIEDEIEGTQTIYLTPEMIQELLNYIESNYRPTEPEIEELDFNEKEVLLNIDFSPPQPDD